jgi:hypothetical protein
MQDKLIEKEERQMNRAIIRNMFLLFMLCLPIKAFATPYDYSVNGQFYVNGVSSDVTGKMTISDEFIYHAAQGESHAYYGFDIVQFSLSVNGTPTPFDFSGNNGSNGNNGLLYYSPAIFIAGKWSYMKAWGINNGQDSWLADPGGLRFFNADMAQYEPTDIDNFGILAPNITVGGPLFATQFQATGGGTIWLTRDTTPVPEPSMLLLLGAGLAGIVFLRKKII